MKRAGTRKHLFFFLLGQEPITNRLLTWPVFYLLTVSVRLRLTLFWYKPSSFSYGTYAKNS